MNFAFKKWYGINATAGDSHPNQKQAPYLRTFSFEKNFLNRYCSMYGTFHFNAATVAPA